VILRTFATTGSQTRNEGTTEADPSLRAASRWSDDANVLCFVALLASSNVELDALAVFE